MQCNAVINYRKVVEAQVNMPKPEHNRYLFNKILLLFATLNNPKARQNKPKKKITNEKFCLKAEKMQKHSSHINSIEKIMLVSVIIQTRI